VPLLLFLFSPVLLFAVTHLQSMEMGYNRLTLHFDKAFSKTQVHRFVLKGKGSLRYVFDLKNCRLAGKHLTDRLKYSDKVRSIRAGQYRRNTVRVVVETPEPYAVADYADLVIVGSALVKTMHEAGAARCAAEAGRFVSDLRRGIDG
jgi:tryptophan synthase alpha subunit